MNPEPLTKVIFRKFREGDVIALFPELPGSYGHVETCESYQTIGQHGPASVDLSKVARLASPAEYAPLKRELERIGYRLRVCKRMTRHDLE